MGGHIVHCTEVDLIRENIVYMGVDVDIDGSLNWHRRLWSMDRTSSILYSVIPNYN